MLKMHGITVYEIVLLKLTNDNFKFRLRFHHSIHLYYAVTSQ